MTSRARYLTIYKVIGECNVNEKNDILVLYILAGNKTDALSKFLLFYKGASFVVHNVIVEQPFAHLRKVSNDDLISIIRIMGKEVIGS